MHNLLDGRHLLTDTGSSQTRNMHNGHYSLLLFLLFFFNEIIHNTHLVTSLSITWKHCYTKLYNTIKRWNTKLNYTMNGQLLHEGIQTRAAKRWDTIRTSCAKRKAVSHD